MFWLFIILYLLPVLPVARRVAYVGTKRTYENMPHRYLIDRMNGLIKISRGVTVDNFSAQNICQNCGAERCFHKGGSFESLNTSHYYGMNPEYKACSKFESWDGKKSDWPARKTLVSTHVPVLTSTFLSLIGWWAIVPVEIVHQLWRHFEPQSSFAKEYNGLESRTEREKRIEEERDALKQRTTDLEKELGLTPHKEIA